MQSGNQWAPDKKRANKQQLPRTHCPREERETKTKFVFVDLPRGVFFSLLVPLTCTVKHACHLHTHGTQTDVVSSRAVRASARQPTHTQWIFFCSSPSQHRGDIPSRYTSQKGQRRLALIGRGVRPTVRSHGVSEICFGLPHDRDTHTLFGRIAAWFLSMVWPQPFRIRIHPHQTKSHAAFPWCFSHVCVWCVCLLSDSTVDTAKPCRRRQHRRRRRLAQFHPKLPWQDPVACPAGSN